MNNSKLQILYNAALLLKGSIFWIAQLKTRWPLEFQQVMGPEQQNFFFDGDEFKYELWQVKFLWYLRIQYLHQIILSPTDESDDIDFTEKNATAFAELLQHLDDKSLSLVIRDAQNNGRKALIILREHYLSKGKPKVISLYIELTCLRRLESMSITDSIIRAENISNALKEDGAIISDRLLIMMVLKGLPLNFKPFTTIITQKKT